MYTSLKEALISKVNNPTSGLDKVILKSLKSTLRYYMDDSPLDDFHMDMLKFEITSDYIKIYSQDRRHVVFSIQHDLYEKYKLPKHIIVDINGVFVINPGYVHGNSKNFKVLDGYTYELGGNTELRIAVSEGDSIIKNCSFIGSECELIYKPKEVNDTNDSRQTILYKLDGTGNILPYKDNLEKLKYCLFNNSNTYKFDKLDLGNISVGINLHDIPSTGLNKDYNSETIKDDKFIFTTKTQNQIKKQTRKDLNLPTGEVRKLDYGTKYANMRGKFGLAWSDVTSI